MSIDEYYNKRKSKQLEEAKELVKEYYKKYKRYPEKEILREYFWLFEDRNQELCKTFQDVIDLEDNTNNSTKRIKQTKPMFNGYEEFLKNISGDVIKNEKFY